ncbi:MFS transporter [Methylocapsa sp. S129]|uniref:MFS transporter n=1 Tax=Methylocapsa sp. S129 TaxID=1641869 RepID=UPI00131B682D|nr:MFS transporter [Methylocapsa sp. S129]
MQSRAAPPIVQADQPDDVSLQRNSNKDRAAPVSARSRRGLDWFVFFVADIQTGFGPFVAVFLTTQKWTQVDIGLVLTVSGLVSLIGQVPFGALVDAARSLRAVAVVALVTIGASAFAFAAWPIFPVVLASRVIHAAASCMLGLALVSISLGLTGESGVSERLGRNAAFASAGTGIAAAIMGACGYYLSNRAVFFLAGALVLPAIIALSRIRANEIGPASDAARGAPTNPKALAVGLSEIAHSRPLVVFALCVALFHLANAAMLPLAASMLTLRSSEIATIMVAAAMVVPQFTVTLLSPWVGRMAHCWGRRPFLLFGFGALCIRGFLFAVTSEPHFLVIIQVLDGVSAAALGVLVPLTIVDLTRERGHFNLAQGAVGCAMGIGAAISTTLTGYISDNFGSHAAFNMLTALAAVGFVAVALAMPETKPRLEA